MFKLIKLIEIKIHLYTCYYSPAIFFQFDKTEIALNFKFSDAESDIARLKIQIYEHLQSSSRQFYPGKSHFN
jgi:hypothetical protein